MVFITINLITMLIASTRLLQVNPSRDHLQYSSAHISNKNKKTPRLMWWFCFTVLFNKQLTRMCTCVHCIFLKISTIADEHFSHSTITPIKHICRLHRMQSQILFYYRYNEYTIRESSEEYNTFHWVHKGACVFTPSVCRSFEVNILGYV